MSVFYFILLKQKKKKIGTKKLVSLESQETNLQRLVFASRKR